MTCAIADSYLSSTARIVSIARHQPARDFLVGLLEPFGARFGIVEFLRQPRAVGVHALHFGLGFGIVLLVLEPRGDGVFQRIDRLAEPDDDFS